MTRSILCGDTNSPVWMQNDVVAKIYACLLDDAVGTLEYKVGFLLTHLKLPLLEMAIIEMWKQFQTY